MCTNENSNHSNLSLSLFLLLRTCNNAFFFFIFMLLFFFTLNMNANIHGYNSLCMQHVLFSFHFFMIECVCVSARTFGSLNNNLWKYTYILCATSMWMCVCVEKTCWSHFFSPPYIYLKRIIIMVNFFHAPLNAQCITSIKMFTFACLFLCNQKWIYFLSSNFCVCAPILASERR